MSKTIKGNYNLIVTGATGFVGCHLIKRLSPHFPKDRTLLFTGTDKSFIKANTKKMIKRLGYKLIEADFIKKDSLLKFDKSVNLVIYLAAETNTSKTNHRVNYQGLVNFYNKLNINPNTHFIYLGTMVNVAGRISCKKPVNESTKYYPTNNYTKTKIKGERFLLKKSKRDNFKLTILVPNTIYGNGSRKDSFFDVLKKGVVSRSPLFRLNWPGRSAFIHVDDVVTAILSFSKLNKNNIRSQKYYLFSENLTLSQVSQLMHNKMGYKYKLINLPNIFWKILAKLRTKIFFFQNILPSGIYNQLWRAGILFDDVVFAKSKKINRFINDWNPSLLKDNINNL